MNIEQYTLTYRPTRSKEVSFQLVAYDSKKNYAIKYPHRMLYIVKLNDDFLYVGEAKSELAKRFQRGFGSYRRFKRTGKAKGGYKGYKWIELIDPELSKSKKLLDIWTILFPSSYDEKRSEVEAIEGEVVWEIRNKTGNWPIFQNEIHFNNEFQEAKNTAKEILENIK